MHPQITQISQIEDPMKALLRPVVVSFVLLSLITGVLYPAFVTGAAQALFPLEANGSLLTSSVISHPSSAVGHPSSVISSLATLGTTHPSSRLIGQPFSDPNYFWSRPSATGPVPYNGAASSGSNLGPNNPALAQAIEERMAALRAADSGNTQPAPVDLVTASGSGLDPHISPEAAEYQVGRVARLRGLTPDSVRALVTRTTTGRQFGILGEPVVNVLQLNLALDSQTPAP
jgi:K+-transporting ATPase ATPase C chain